MKERSSESFVSSWIIKEKNLNIKLDDIYNHTSFIRNSVKSSLFNFLRQYVLKAESFEKQDSGKNTPELAKSDNIGSTSNPHSPTAGLMDIRVGLIIEVEKFLDSLITCLKMNF